MNKDEAKKLFTAWWKGWLILLLVILVMCGMLSLMGILFWILITHPFWLFWFVVLNLFALGLGS